MPPEHSDWPGQQQPQAGSLGPVPAGLAQAGLAEPPAPAGRRRRACRARPGRQDPEFGAHALRRQHYRIGRDPKSDIVMADSRVSWRHGVLRVEGDGWLLEDVGSTNGTFVGLQRIERIPIAADCVVRLGNPDDGPILRCIPQGPPPRRPAVGVAPGRPVERPPRPPRSRAAPVPERAAPVARAAPVERAAPVGPGAPVARLPAPSLSREILIPQAPPRQPAGPRWPDAPHHPRAARRCRRRRPPRPAAQRRPPPDLAHAAAGQGPAHRPRPRQRPGPAPTSTSRGTTPNCASHPPAPTRSSTSAATTAPSSTAAGSPPR